MHIQIIAPLPEILHALNYGMPGRAQQKEKITLRTIDLRDFAQDKHRRIDDRPYGGGPGMVLKPEPIIAAIEDALKTVPAGTPITYLGPHGKTFNQTSAIGLSKRAHLILVAGRYEGIDERVYALYPHEVWSLGDFVLSGGELAVCCMIDAITRLLPGVVSNAASIEQDSFNAQNGWLDHSHYTKPVLIKDLLVPTVLRSGNHQAIAKWRHQNAYENTKRYRPDLLKK